MYRICRVSGTIVSPHPSPWSRNELAFVFVPCPVVFFIRRCFRREKNQQVPKKLSNKRQNEFVQLHGLVQFFLMMFLLSEFPCQLPKKKMAGGVGQSFSCSSYSLFPVVPVQFFHHFSTHWALWQGSGLNVVPRNIWSKAWLKYVPLRLDKIFRYPYLSTYEQAFLQFYLVLKITVFHVCRASVIPVLLCIS